MTTTSIKPKLKREYPCTVNLGNRTKATFRLMESDDAERVLQFARALPEEDLLFLRVDLTDPDVVEQWLRNQKTGRSVALYADVNGEMAGYASLHLNETNWQRHLGEIRVQVGRGNRGIGLGRALAAEIFAIARDLGLRKIVAQMTSDQKSAIATFEKLGFQPEALLQDFVVDRAGRSRDLVMMSYDLEGLTDRVD
jgi:RimJ/RimL family protein N-acetyltransferase